MKNSLSGKILGLSTQVPMNVKMPSIIYQNGVCMKSTISKVVCKLYVPIKEKGLTISCKSLIFKWALTDSNRRPSACKADALNQLS